MSADHDLNQTHEPNDFHEICNNLSEPIGDATGELYGYGVSTVGGGPVAEHAVSEVIGGFVSHGWHDVCDTAESAGSFLGEAYHGLTDALSHAADSVGSMLGFGHEQDAIDPLQESPGGLSSDPADDKGASWWVSDSSADDNAGSWWGGSSADDNNSSWGSDSSSSSWGESSSSSSTDA